MSTAFLNFEHSPEVYGVMNEETKLALIGNFFKPSAFEAALFGTEGQAGFMQFCSATTYPAQSIKPAKIEEAIDYHSKLTS